MIESIICICIGIWLIRLGRDIYNEITQYQQPRTTARSRRREAIYKIGRN